MRVVLGNDDFAVVDLGGSKAVTVQMRPTGYLVSKALDIHRIERFCPMLQPFVGDAGKILAQVKPELQEGAADDFNLKWKADAYGAHHGHLGGDRKFVIEPFKDHAGHYDMDTPYDKGYVAGFKGLPRVDKHLDYNLGH